jgi:hypothetical protein
MVANRVVWDEYRRTWEVFSRRLDELQATVEAGCERSRAESSLLEVERARLAHNAARDKLAAQLSDEMAALDQSHRDLGEKRRVRETARLLWEFAGKPNGTADSDWLRAEQLLRSAAG